jgi:hypothetical protein
MTGKEGGTGKARILQIAHNHPRFHPGGTELTALALHRQALMSGLDSWYLGALDETQILPNLGTQMIALSADQREAALCASCPEFRPGGAAGHSLGAAGCADHPHAA